MAQRRVVQAHLGFVDVQLRPRGNGSLAQVDVLGHDAPIPVQPQPAEINIQSPRAQFGQQRVFNDVRQAHAVEIIQRGEQQQRRG